MQPDPLQYRAVSEADGARQPLDKIPPPLRLWGGLLPIITRPIADNSGY